MDIARAHCCCFTGHRPEKLLSTESELRAALRCEISAAIADGYTTFISGMARGVDVYAAEEVLLTSERDPSIRLICAYPYPDCCEHFASVWRERCRAISRRADLRVDVSGEYSSACYQRRNEWMVERSSRLIAVYDGSHGGTYNTIVSAMRNELDVRMIMI